MDDVLFKTGTIIRQADLMMLSRDADSHCLMHDWKTEGFRDIAFRLADREFPCLFARHAWKSETLLFGLISQQATEKDLLAVMQQFVHRTKTLPEEARLYSPLILIFERSGLHTLAEAQQFAWQQLQFLHDNDTHSWPEHIPENPQDSAWSFCFGGVELFVNISCPGHSRLRSRNLGKRAVLIINPRPHFDILASQRDPKGIKIREKIRHRVCNYNNGYVPSELGFYGDENSLEWKQYQLDEPGALNLARCPLHIRKDKPEQ
ncbi:YqcI/YcgG family protein [Candidatus Pantoea deserta]|uniref:YqcI/YcgG family protein n=2 Tax=Candidatus Pantoea deserta TaxID=1869313 RepID=A0A3N4PVW9_9GAMM|nr:YqcI/YcgG family protein [Pantoea deserta]